MNRYRTAALRADALEVWRGERCLFAGLDFTLDGGGLALLTGPNGAGKTTLLRVLAGLTSPTDGRAMWEGENVDRLDPDRRREIAYHGHADGLKKQLTVTENLSFYRALWGSSASAPDGLLSELGMEDAADLRVRYLSAGQRRRVGLATLRLRRSRLWLLDEPGTNLDEQGRRMIGAWIGAHLERGGLAVIATHEPARFSRPGSLLIEL